MWFGWSLAWASCRPGFGCFASCLDAVTVVACASSVVHLFAAAFVERYDVVVFGAGVCAAVVLEVADGPVGEDDASLYP